MIEDIKYINLKNYLKDLGSAVVAFSGGVDSTFLCKVAKEVLNEKALSITVDTPYIPKWEIEEAKALAKEIGIRHQLLEVPVILEEIKFNPIDRCYICKNFVFTSIKEASEKAGYSFVMDGTNADDVKDYRPGLRALKELQIKSPLLELGINKAEIRAFSKKLGLSTWDKPSYACLLSRIPYNEEIKTEDLQLIEKAEKYIMDLGYKAIRVRKHGDLARIELPKQEIKEFVDKNFLELVSRELKDYGFRYVTLDMEGYRIGSLNEIKELDNK